jgi:hypothetical protein
VQWKAAAEKLNAEREKARRVRLIELDNSQLPGLVFSPLASPASRPDLRGYEVVASPNSDSQAVSRPDSDEDLAFASIRRIAALLRNRKIS